VAAEQLARAGHALFVSELLGGLLQALLEHISKTRSS
jgi:hypothetical protein